MRNAHLGFPCILSPSNEHASFYGVVVVVAVKYQGAVAVILTTSDSGKVYPGVQFFPRNVHRITSMQSWEAKLSQANKDGKTVVANFSASWSHPCRDIMPTYFELANKYSFLVFLTVDADELAELCTSWNINATPTFYFLKDGRQLDKFVGADKLELKKKVAAVADSATKAHN
ncbi:hypothetical protein RIF29_17027 [Crotalaria pallida]|uniref:Thioredoxin domain-containing protein n=1 Tax=Crotalaria pallida TaxID=3830 RepID=A0AAN9FIH3_CROPI